MVIDEVDEDSSNEDQDEGYDDAEDEKNVKEDQANSDDTQMPPPIKRGVEIEEVFDVGSKEEDSVPSNKDYINKTDTKMPPIRRGVKIEETFDEVSKEEHSVSPTNEKEGKGERTTIQSQKLTVPFSIPDDNERRYVELIEELRRTETSKLQAALDVKLDVKLLEEYIFALQKVGLPRGDYEFLHKSLAIISQSTRFTVAAMMLSDCAIKAIENIFSQLRSICTNPNGLDMIQNRFLNC
ncbi:unnamed protein product [Hymenolepis diminuta]|uniref:Uncharacterized protein n=1 Tax=Hymenolepis diminuta TaxID=6216 RepID=A0A564YAR4_HYMDI|nr:unnamed protein product [Hymenolepis diminuta]